MLHRLVGGHDDTRGGCDIGEIILIGDCANTPGV